MLQDLEKKLHTQIPLTAFMQIGVKALDKNYLYTNAPINPNINDKGTGFAGSLSTLVTISAWSVCYLSVKELGYEDAMIAVIKSDTAYRKPVTKELICKTEVLSIEQIETLKKKLIEKKSASVKINSKIIQDEEVCVEFKGVYVIKV